MVHNPFQIFGLPDGTKESEIKHIALMRETIVKARELLRSNPRPDTFAGRKTQEPFPEEHIE